MCGSVRDQEHVLCNLGISTINDRCIAGAGAVAQFELGLGRVRVREGRDAVERDKTQDLVPGISTSELGHIAAVVRKMRPARAHAGGIVARQLYIVCHREHQRRAQAGANILFRVYSRTIINLPRSLHYAYGRRIAY